MRQKVDTRHTDGMVKMMILIDMDMPETCEECPFIVVFPSKRMGTCTAHNPKGGIDEARHGKRQDWCPLREVFNDPHRRVEHCRSCVHYGDGLGVCGECGIVAGTIHTKYERREE